MLYGVGIVNGHIYQFYIGKGNKIAKLIRKRRIDGPVRRMVGLAETKFAHSSYVRAAVDTFVGSL